MMTKCWLDFDRDKAKWVGIYSFLFMFIAHAYRYMNLGYTDDSVEIVQRSDRVWQLRLGRFLQPVYWEMRGDIVMPYLIGLLSALWLAVAVYFIVRILNIKSKVSYAMICAVLCCNSTLSIANATFVSWADVYMLSFMFSVLGVYVWRRVRYGFLFAPIFICVSLALYQAYLQTAILLFLMALIKSALDGERLNRMIADGFKALVSLLLGLILYDAAVRIVEHMAQVERSVNYNGIGNLGSFLDGSILELLRDTYLYPFKYMTDLPTYHPQMTGFFYGLVLVIMICALAGLVMSRRVSMENTIFASAMVLLIPLGVNAVYFISNGVVHSLTTYACFLFLAFPVILLEKLAAEKGRFCSIGTVMRGICILLLSVTCYNHVIYANHMYLRRDLEFQSTLSLMTRVIDRVEQTEGYDAGLTPVAFVGTMFNSALSMERPGFEHVRSKSEFMNENHYAVSSEFFYPWYFWEILGYPFNILGDYEREKIANERDVRLMPVFPEEGSCQMRDGVMVIKLGAVAPPSE